MKNKEKIEVITRYQDCDFVHSLTCGNDSKHSLLVAKVLRRRVYLVCPDCGYEQRLRDDLLDCCNGILKNIKQMDMVRRLMDGQAKSLKNKKNKGKKE